MADSAGDPLLSNGEKMQNLIITTLAVAIACPAIAVPVNPDASDEIAAIWLVATPKLLRTNGTVHNFNHDLHQWEEGNGFYDLPVPIEQVADWYVSAFVATNGDWWYRNPGAGEEWEIMARPDWAPVSATGSQLGAVNDLFRLTAGIPSRIGTGGYAQTRAVPA